MRYPLLAASRALCCSDTVEAGRVGWIAVVSQPFPPSSRRSRLGGSHSYAIVLDLLLSSSYVPGGGTNTTRKASGQMSPPTRPYGSSSNSGS
jgi:hypothetical protein